jgi:hypothetical protein
MSKDHLVNCPHPTCRKQFKVRQHVAGTSVDCTHCRTATFIRALTGGKIAAEVPTRKVRSFIPPSENRRNQSRRQDLIAAA